MAMNLQTYSTKLQEKTVKDIKAIVAVSNEFKGERELIEVMVKEFKEKHPEKAEKAKEYSELMEKTYN